MPYATLKVLKDNGLRLLLVGYESGNQAILNNVKKGVRLDVARRFTRDAKALGIAIHGTFILGLPGETRETIAETIRFAAEIDPDTIQVSLAAPYPGTALYEEAQRNGWLEADELVDGAGRAGERDRLPAPLAHRDLPLGGPVLPPLLLPPAQDVLPRRRDAARPPGHEAPPRRGPRLPPLPPQPPVNRRRS